MSEARSFKDGFETGLAAATEHQLISVVNGTALDELVCECGWCGLSWVEHIQSLKLVRPC